MGEHLLITDLTYSLTQLLVGIQDSAVSIATGYGLEGHGVGVRVW
jgi:hypothetical protein